jgi:predicted anti-sigma-YlaC factor YlaD
MTDAQAAADRRASSDDPGTARHLARTGYRWLLILFLVAGTVQIFLAGLGVFHLHAYGLDATAGDSALTPHRTLGFIMAGIALLIGVLAPLARAGRQAIALAVLLVVATSFVQSLLAGLADDHAVYGGLHALDGLLIIAIAAYLLYRARARQADAREQDRLPDREAQETR